MRTPVLIVLGFNLGLSACFYQPLDSKLDNSRRMATTEESDSNTGHTIAAPSGALSGASVTVPSGALAIDTQLIIEEAIPLSETSLASALTINPDISITPVGSGLIIRPTENAELTQALTISLPIPPTISLLSQVGDALTLTAGKEYVVFFKYFRNGELIAGVLPGSELRFSDDGSLVSFEGFFGAYWLAEVSSPILEKVTAITAEPIIIDSLLNKDGASGFDFV